MDQVVFIGGGGAVGVVDGGLVVHAVIRRCGGHRHGLHIGPYFLVTIVLFLLERFAWQPKLFYFF